MEQGEIKEKKALLQTKYDNYMKLNIQDTLQIDDNIDPSNEQAEEEDDYFIIKENGNLSILNTDPINPLPLLNHGLLLATKLLL